MFHVKHRKAVRMIKRFRKHERVTLCLIQETGYQEFNTWCVNAIYLKQDKHWRHFQDGDKLYSVHKETNMVQILWSEIIYTGEQFEEWNELERFEFAQCTNIVKGWQF